MRWAVTEWDSCPEEAIKNCFIHCFKQDAGNVTEFDASGDSDETRMQMELDAKKHGVAFIRVGIHALLSPK